LGRFDESEVIELTIVPVLNEDSSPMSICCVFKSISRLDSQDWQARRINLDIDIDVHVDDSLSPVIQL
jgi:hypothetical protein